MACSHGSSEYNEFRTYIKEVCTKEAVCGRTFIVTSKSNVWLTKICPQCKKPPLERMLYAYNDRGTSQQPGLAHPPHAINPKALVVFSILIDIHHPGSLEEFLSEGIEDRKLPLERSALQEKLRVEEEGVPLEERCRREELAEAFFCAQYQFCPHKFDLDTGKKLGHRDIVPITRKRTINEKGGTADLFQVEVLGDFLTERLSSRIPNSRYDTKDGFGWRYSFALKCFKENNADRFEREKTAFANLRNHQGMVKCVAHFTQRGHSRTKKAPQLGPTIPTTQNLLLEYGQSDLDVYFVDYHPPLLNNEIVGFWKELFEVAKAVEAIHNYKRSFDGQKFNGWHADIKPDNILFIEGKFKLADPGFAVFVPETMPAPQQPVEGGTWGFAAPEHRPGILHPKSRNIDIWSLGCVFSIAATWVTRGDGAIKDFARVRQKAIERIRMEDPESMKDLPPGEYFHNGKCVLDEVGQWHDILRGLLPSQESITGQILDIVDYQMLLEEPENRVDATSLCKQLDKILQNTPRKRSAPQNIIDALKRSEEEILKLPMVMKSAPSMRPLADSSGTAQERKEKKEQILAQGSKRTAQRSEHLGGALQTGVYAHHITSTHNKGTRTDRFRDLPTVKTVLEPPPSPLPPHPPRDIFQVRNQLKHTTGGKLLTGKRLKQVFGASPEKDKILAKYFEDFDIRFLVDNGFSMQRHWDKTMYVLETLVLLGEGLDNDGMDLWFTRGGGKLRGKTKATDFVAAMEHSGNRPQDGTQTDMHLALYKLFDAHVQDLKGYDPWKTRKNLLLIILTDGLWKGTEDKFGVGATILKGESMVRKTLGTLRPKPVGIEFIQLGRDPNATFLLQSLDNDIATEGERDIIDHEHSDGNVNKMFLGSLEKEYDKMPYDETLSP